MKSPSHRSRSIMDSMSTAAKVTRSFSKNRKKKSMISATSLFHIGGTVNSCHINGVVTS